MSWHLFLDESGDLGFDFENKRPSKYLTITILAISQRSATDAIRCAVKKTLKRKVNQGKKGRKRPCHELKGAATSVEVKRYFYGLVSGEKFGLYSLTIDKRKVLEHLRSTASSKDRLYNFIARKVIDAIPFEQANGGVQLIVDKSKGKSGMADFNAYLENQLQGRIQPSVKLNIHHANSCVDAGLSAVDLFCWGIFRKYEQGDPSWFNCFKSKVQFDETLF